MSYFEYGSVQPTKSARKAVVIASGKSLKGFDLWKLNRPDIFTITVNDSVKSAIFADAWFTLDPWGLDGPQLPSDKFQGKLYAAVPEDFGDPNCPCRNHRIDPPPNITYLRRVQGKGLSLEPDTIHTGNSGFGAFNLATLLGAKYILLLGIDATRGYFYSDTKFNQNLNHLPEMFLLTLPQLQKMGIKVFNGSPESRVHCFTRYEPDYALELFLNE